jgi:hypothetical protein
MLYQKSIIMIIHNNNNTYIHAWHGVAVGGAGKSGGERAGGEGWGGLETGIKAELGIVKLKINRF